MKPELPPTSKVLGSDDLLSRFDLSGAFQRFCGPKKPKEDLSSFLPNIYGTSHLQIKDDQSWHVLFSSLMRLVERPPIVGKEIVGLSASALSGFNLAAGPIPENCRFFPAGPGDSAMMNAVPTPSTSRADDSEVVADSSKHRKRLKRSLEDDVSSAREEDEEAPQRGRRKEKKKKKKKKQKKSKKNDEESRKTREVPFY
ncbi:Mediator of RNA polymerase II transcription subunit 19 [Aphelenchoides fujianensis]|nr:Mediator of RNA polymerase II transcription subunit 19 [Aphelenchoides fujianensis]